MTRKTQILLVFAAVSCALLTASGALAQSRSSAEINLLRAVNATRTAHGLRPVSLDARLTRAARAHSVEMLRGGYFAHGNLHGRMVAFRVRGPFVGENLAWGNGSYASPATVISEWLRSPEHRANLLRPGFARIGIGVVTTSGQGTFLGTGGATVMTADFAGH
jgi:uncharacterized protein YkwD